MQVKLIDRSGTFICMDVDEGPLKGGYMRTESEIIARIARSLGKNQMFLWYSCGSDRALHAVTGRDVNDALEELYQAALKGETQ